MDERKEALQQAYQRWTQGNYQAAYELYDDVLRDAPGSGSKPKDAVSKEITSQQTSDESHHSQMTHYQQCSCPLYSHLPDMV